MADSAVFERVSEELEQATGLSRIEARGTVRLALKEAFFEPQSVDAPQMRLVLERLLPRELEARGVVSPEEICAQLAAALDGLGASVESPDTIFERLVRR